MPGFLKKRICIIKVEISPIIKGKKLVCRTMILKEALQEEKWHGLKKFKLKNYLFFR